MLRHVLSFTSYSFTNSFTDFGSIDIMAFISIVTMAFGSAHITHCILQIV